MAVLLSGIRGSPARLGCTTPSIAYHVIVGLQSLIVVELSLTSNKNEALQVTCGRCSFIPVVAVVVVVVSSVVVVVVVVAVVV